MEKHLMKGAEAIAEAAVLAGCRQFFGYPITPQNQIPEYMSRRMPQVGGCFLQAESEVSAINMVYGAAGSGARVMTSSSSPGISLKQEGISYIACAELPCVIVNIVRGGPGLGGIQPAQSDYFQCTKGGGHGDYRLLVLAPDSVQEAVDFTYQAFDLADKYRNPVLILGDGMIGQMMEPVVMPPEKTEFAEKPWAATGRFGQGRRIINSLYIGPAELEQVNLRLQRKYETIAANETRCEEYMTEDADIIIAAYGTTARIAKKSIKELRARGIKAGLLRPITLWPFPSEYFAKACGHAKCMLTVEMSCGQMVEDVRLAVNGRVPVDFYGRVGGMVPSWREIMEAAEKTLKGGKD